MTSGIYKLINQTNGRFYIGSSANIEQRVKKHFRLLRQHKHENNYMQNDYTKTGGHFTFVVLVEEIMENARLNKETELLQQLHDQQNTCYNINKTTFITGRVKTPEGLEKIKVTASANAKKLWQNPEFRQNQQRMTASSAWRDAQKKGVQRTNVKTYNVILLSPTGKEIVIEQNLHSFAKQVGLASSGVYGLVSGRYKHVKGWQLKSNAKIFPQVKAPDGAVYEVGTNISLFCRQHNIPCSSHFGALLKKRLRCCYGWTLAI
jgi:group I intron endonuclease